MSELNFATPQRGESRDGIPIEKGVVITEDFLEKNVELLGKYFNHFMLYPDIWLELTKSKNCPITLLYYQRIFLRSCMRYRYTYYTATRGSSKSFIAILSQILACIFLPGSKRFLVSDIKKASLDITKQKVAEILEWYPLLANEIAVRRESTDYFMIIFKNGSSFQVLTMSAATRGQRMHGGRPLICPAAA